MGNAVIGPGKPFSTVVQLTTTASPVALLGPRARTLVLASLRSVGARASAASCTTYAIRAVADDSRIYCPDETEAVHRRDRETQCMPGGPPTWTTSLIIWSNSRRWK
jgi:hypothetical protein